MEGVLLIKALFPDETGSMEKVILQQERHHEYVQLRERILLITCCIGSTFHLPAVLPANCPPQPQVSVLELNIGDGYSANKFFIIAHWMVAQYKSTQYYVLYCVYICGIKSPMLLVLCWWWVLQMYHNTYCICEPTSGPVTELAQWWQVLG